LFGLSGLSGFSGFLRERNLPDEQNQPDKQNKPYQQDDPDRPDQTVGFWTFAGREVPSWLEWHPVL
jgi:hypothetical protein